MTTKTYHSDRLGRVTVPTSADEAVSQLMQVCTEIASKAEILKVAAENLFDYPADHIDWGYVGNAEYVNDQLTELMKFIGLMEE